MSNLEAETELVRKSIAELPGWAGRDLKIEPAIAVLASPSWRGVDGSPWRATDRKTGDSLFVKTMWADAKLYIDITCAFTAAQRAAELGIGPRVFAADPDTGILIQEDLNAGWRAGTLERALEPKTVDSILAARRRFQEAPALARTNGVFTEIDRFYRAAKQARAQMPSDADWLVGELQFAAEILRKIPVQPVPIHGDGNMSNVMISDRGEIRLIDWDRATTADPLEDLGSFFVEAFEQEPEARDAFVRYYGSFNEQAYARMRIYGIADDLRWGLIGAFVAAKSARSTVEFYKFASWRFLRCRMNVREPRFAETLRRAA
jgi:hypothetical protein